MKIHSRATQTVDTNDVASLFSSFQSTDLGKYHEIQREQLAQDALSHWPLLAEIHNIAIQPGVQS